MRETNVVEPRTAKAGILLRHRMDRLLVFRMSGELFGVAGKYTRQIVHLGKITPVPQTPPYLLGVTSLRGRILPVLDVRSLLGLSGEVNPYVNPTLVVEVGSIWAGLVVDSVDGFEPYEPANVTGFGSGMREEIQKYGEGLLTQERGLAILLNLHKVIEKLKLEVQLQF